LVLLFAWETLLPTIGFFPVTWHSRATADSFIHPTLEKTASILKIFKFFNDLRTKIVS
jgi:hypothetical protein